MMDSIEDELEEVFMRHENKWLIDGEMRLPNAKDIRITIDQMKILLYAEKEPRVSGEVGGLIIKREYDNFDVYVYIGDDTTEETQ
jgi:hypothetical protein